MKTIDEIIEASKFKYERGDSSGNIDIIREIDEEKLAVYIQEYAEEYAKAFAVFCQVDVRRRTVNDLMQEFKESLKK